MTRKDIEKAIAFYIEARRTTTDKERLDEINDTLTGLYNLKRGGDKK